MRTSQRVPSPGMLLQAAAELDLDLPRSYLVGDRLSDIEAGIRAGCHVVLVLTGYGATEAQSLTRLDLASVRIAADLAEAVQQSIPTLSGLQRGCHAHACRGHDSAGDMLAVSLRSLSKHGTLKSPSH